MRPLMGAAIGAASKGGAVGKDQNVDLGSRFKDGVKRLFKPEGAPLTIRGETLRQAQRSPAVQEFLADAMIQEKHLEQKGLIKPS